MSQEMSKGREQILKQKAFDLSAGKEKQIVSLSYFLFTYFHNLLKVLKQKLLKHFFF